MERITKMSDQCSRFLIVHHDAEVHLAKTLHQAGVVDLGANRRDPTDAANGVVTLYLVDTTNYPQRHFGLSVPRPQSALCRTRKLR